MVRSEASHGSLIGNITGGYQVDELIGRGAMGTVYLAHDPNLGRRVALKVLLGSLARTPSIVKQFEREALAAAPLNHPGIVRVYSAGTDKGTPYIAMEFVDGEPLDAFLRRKGRLSWQHATHIAGQVALALQCAHENGVVHRDVKPSNIMLDRNGRVRLADFGIAKAQWEDGSESPGPMVIGTPQYMSPEQVSGSDAGPSSDLFSLGVTLFEMIAGRTPFHGDSAVSLAQSISNDTPQRLDVLVPGVPDDVARFVAYLLEKNFDDRPSNATVAVALITRLHAQQGGRSALPEALTNFIKQEAIPRPFSAVRSRHARGTDARGLFGSFRNAMVPAGLLLLFILSAGVHPLHTYLRRMELPVSARALTQPNMERAASDDPGMVRLNLGGYAVRSLRWTEDGSRLLAVAQGLEGTLTERGRGVLSIEPDTGHMTSLRAPKGPSMDAGYWDAQPGGFSLFGLPNTPQDSDLSNAILIHAAADSGQSVFALVQRWNDAVPNPKVLVETPNFAWEAPGGGPWEEARTGQLIASPDGHSLCAALYDIDFGGYYLVERDTRQPDFSEATGSRRTSPGINVDPKSVRYSPDGVKIAFVGTSQGGAQRELRLLYSDAEELDGRLLATGLASDTFAFGPDGRRIAAITESADGGAPEVVIIDIYRGEIVARLGKGTLSPECWAPSGNYLIVARPPVSPEGRSQLWAVSPTDPSQQYQVTNQPNGVTTPYALSRDGERLAATVGLATPLGADLSPAIVFIRIGEIAVRPAA